MSVKREQNVQGPYVFCSAEGKALHNFERDWNPALKAAKIPEFTTYTFASRLAMLGTDLYPVQRGGRWKTQVMVQRYAHLSPDYIKAAVERLAASNSGRATGTKTGTMAAGENEERAAST